jgi:predicted signal transduction protein with EAL and GGDEF domain
VRVADCLRDQLPPEARAFRLGGDEFAVLVEPCGRAQALALAASLNLALREGQFCDHAGTQISASIGVVHKPAASRVPHASDLIQRADIALYSVKRGNRDDHALFDDSMLHAIQQRNEIERALREAIAEGRIETWFQPIVSADDHRVLRLEALARWHHGQRGWIEPSRFVAIAEQNYLAAALDLGVLRAAVQALPRIRALVPHAGMSVNVSVQSLLDADYIAAVPRILAEGGLCGHDLILELTETMLSENEQVLARPIAVLREHGVLIQLDDFGVGYSSLGRLAQLDPLGIKLDGSFVLNRRHGGDRVCRAVIGLADQLGIQVTAEFVESQEDAQFLRSAGCAALQGYWLTAPLPLAQLLEWLRARGTGSPLEVAVAPPG